MSIAQQVMNSILAADMAQKEAHKFCVSQSVQYEDIDGEDGLFYVHYYFSDSSVLCTGHGFLSVVG